MITQAVGVDFLDADPDSTLGTPASVWARVVDDRITADPNLRACVVAYIPDMCTGVFDCNVRLNSLDHARWLVRPYEPGWLLLDLHGESLSGGRGLYHGEIFAEDDTLVAAPMQESLCRTMDHRRYDSVRRAYFEGSHA